MDKKLGIFDLDGTLYKSEVVSVPALKRAFGEFDIELSREIILDQFGEPTEQIIKNLVPDEKYEMRDQIREGIVEKERELIPEKATLYDGVKEMLRDLKEEGIELAICSNGRLDYIRDVIRTTSIEDHFSSIKGYDEEKTKAGRIKDLRRSYSKDKVFMIGDRYHDIDAAEQAGVTSIGALYGYGEEEAKRADHVVEKPEEISPLILD